MSEDNRGNRNKLASSQWARLNGAARGQAIVMLALMMVILAAAVGLAIDGGNYFFLARSVRNGTDASALAAGYTMCEKYYEPVITRNQAIRDEALNAAQANNFAVDASSTLTVEIESEITSEPVASSADKSGYVRVAIDTEAPTYFIHLVYGGPRHILVDTIVHCEPEQVGGPSNMAIISLDQDACGAVDFPGTSTIRTNAGIWVNSDADADEGPCDAADLSGSNLTEVCEPGLNVVGDADLPEGSTGGYSEDGTFCDAPGDGVPTTGRTAIADPLANLKPPLAACSGTPVDFTYNSPGGVTVIDPGHYSQIKAQAGKVILNPGIYCIESSADNQGFTSVGGQFEGDGVMIYLKHGSFTLAASAINELRAPNATTCYDNSFGTGTCDWKGMLLYSDQGYTYGNQTAGPDPIRVANGVWEANDNIDISIGGSGGSNFVGTIYAPMNHCKLVGSSGTVGFTSQFICETFQNAGTSVMEIYYDPSQVFALPPTLSYAN